jgi:hypothetical protein
MQTAFLRCIFGDFLSGSSLSLESSWLSWREGTVRRLAESAYREQFLPAGILDATHLAILADALEEAGCTEEKMLAHLRDPHSHVRGCWAVDLLLGKS